MRPADRRHRQRGVVMVLAAILLVVVGAFLAVSFNAGHGVAVKGELQNAVDSAALAGVKELDGQLASITTARTVANNFAGRHVTDPRVTVVPKLVEFGNFDPGTRTWTPIPVSVATLYLVNGIRVVAARQDGQPGGGALPAFFGQAFLNRSKFDVSAEAIAYAGTLCEVTGTCDSPFVVRFGCLVSGDLRCEQDYSVGVSNATVDSIGFSDMNPMSGVTSNQSANTPRICAGVQSTEQVTCTMGQSQLATSNGSQLSSNCPGGMTLCQAIQARYPAGTEMRIPVVIYPNDTTPFACTSAHYGGVGSVVSTMKVRIDGVWCNSGGTRTGACAFSTGQCITLHTLCDDTNPTPGSCVALGAATQAPALGR